MIIPLMKPNEWEFLQSYLHKDQIMLEYGSGRSTSIISGHVRTLYSVEHDAKWYNKVSNDIKHLPNIKGCVRSLPAWRRPPGRSVSTDRPCRERCQARFRRKCPPRSG